MAATVFVQQPEQISQLLFLKVYAITSHTRTEFIPTETLVKVFVHMTEQHGQALDASQASIQALLPHGPNYIRAHCYLDTVILWVLKQKGKNRITVKRGPVTIWSVYIAILTNNTKFLAYWDFTHNLHSFYGEITLTDTLIMHHSQPARADTIATTKQSTTQRCQYFIGHSVCIPGKPSLSCLSYLTGERLAISEVIPLYLDRRVDSFHTQ